VDRVPVRRKGHFTPLDGSIYRAENRSLRFRSRGFCPAIPSPHPTFSSFSLDKMCLPAYSISWVIERPNPRTPASLLAFLLSGARSYGPSLCACLVAGGPPLRNKPHFAQFWCSISPFRINTYVSAHKCCI
jgi:hypothetical protein